MCQFHSCHSHAETSCKLFQSLSPTAAAGIRAGWWAYYQDGSQSIGYLEHSHNFYHGAVVQPVQPSLGNSIEREQPTYDYGYGTNL